MRCISFHWFFACVDKLSCCSSTDNAEDYREDVSRAPRKSVVLRSIGKSIYRYTAADDSSSREGPSQPHRQAAVTRQRVCVAEVPNYPLNDLNSVRSVATHMIPRAEIRSRYRSLKRPLPQDLLHQTSYQGSVCSKPGLPNTQAVKVLSGLQRQFLFQ